MEYGFPKNVAIRERVDKIYQTLDHVLGRFLLFIILFLAFTVVISIIQDTLLYSVDVADIIRKNKLQQTIGVHKLKQKNDDNSKISINFFNIFI